MAAQIGGFRTPEDAARYYELYDNLVARNWPVPRHELDVPTSFGTTMSAALDRNEVRRSSSSIRPQDPHSAGAGWSLHWPNATPSTPPTRSAPLVEASKPLRSVRRVTWRPGSTRC